MNANEFMALCRTHNPDFKETWIRLRRDAESKEKIWIATLQRQGISAAHPDDGWVNREKNEVQFFYPDFNNGVKIGSLIALGEPKQYRIVKIIGHRVTFAGELEYWKFEELTNASETD